MQVDAEERAFYDVSWVSDSAIFACGRGVIYKTDETVITKKMLRNNIWNYPEKG
ncbi:MAG: hypothetical protein J6Y47_01280 [Bacteroidales bacterium]|nr:hypothetical protein [Bacteroidales bacterium]